MKIKLVFLSESELSSQKSETDQLFIDLTLAIYHGQCKKIHIGREERSALRSYVICCIVE
jgi:hypothetical protein